MGTNKETMITVLDSFYIEMDRCMENDEFDTFFEICINEDESTPTGIYFDKNDILIKVSWTYSSWLDMSIRNKTKSTIVNYKHSFPTFEFFDSVWLKANKIKKRIAKYEKENRIKKLKVKQDKKDEHFKEAYAKAFEDQAYDAILEELK